VPTVVAGAARGGGWSWDGGGGGGILDRRSGEERKKTRSMDTTTGGVEGEGNELQEKSLSCKGKAKPKTRTLARQRRKFSVKKSPQSIRLTNSHREERARAQGRGSTRSVISVHPGKGAESVY